MSTATMTRPCWMKPSKLIQDVVAGDVVESAFRGEAGQFLTVSRVIKSKDGATFAYIVYFTDGRNLVFWENTSVAIPD